MLDIHAHILPQVDDGSQSLEESLTLLKMMQEQGITDVIATPHFYPQEDTLEKFKERTEKAFSLLKTEAAKQNLPNIYLGCEILYFEGIATASSLEAFCLNSSPYLLLELTDDCIDKELFKNIASLKKNSVFHPIIAHAERYFNARKYKKFLSVLKDLDIPIQINASSVTSKNYNRAIKKLINSGLTIILATDTHSVKNRPPLMSKAIRILRERFGNECVTEILKNSAKLQKNIVRLEI